MVKPRSRPFYASRAQAGEGALKKPSHGRGDGPDADHETAGAIPGPPAATGGRRPRVLVHVAAAPCEPPLPALLEADGLDPVTCRDGHAVLEQVMNRPAAAVIYALRPDCRDDLGILRLLRRAAPDVPLVLLAAEDSLDTRKVTQTLRPIYYAVCPVDGAELRDVVRATLSRRGRGAGAGTGGARGTTPGR